ncbi:MAG: hypothetical protein KHY46_02850 [Clostridiales bacterium]|nr:hypothetical protein [Clostridiales bacterium]
MKAKKEICYLFQNAETENETLLRRKENLTRQGCLVVTVIQGHKDIKTGLMAVLKHHLPG